MALKTNISPIKGEMSKKRGPNKPKAVRLQEAADLAKLICWELVSTEYKNTDTPLEFRCPYGHTQYVPLKHLTESRQCKDCTAEFGNPQARGELAKLAAEHKWKLITRMYVNNYTAMEFKCPNDHVRYIRAKDFPGQVFENHNGCPVCRESDPQSSEDNFRRAVENLGGVVKGIYKGSNVHIECQCVNGHLCYPVPSRVKQRDTICSWCANRSVDKARIEFNERVVQAGGKVFGDYVNSRTRVTCVCINDHLCFPEPTHVQQGGGLCRKCSGKCPEQSEENFRHYMTELGIVVIGKYRTTDHAIKCVCVNGHTFYPRPGNVLSRKGIICLDCTGRSSNASAENFKRILHEAGFEQLETYTTSNTGIRCKCSAEHVSIQVPNKVTQRGLSCKNCTGYGSYPEKMVRKTLDFLGIEFVNEFTPKCIKKLRFDFKFNHNGISYYVEVDGEQHQKNLGYFHREPEDFHNAHQRDLVKNYVIRSLPNTKLIRLNHHMFADRKHRTKLERIQILANYFNAIFEDDSDLKIYCDYDIYTWIDEEPKDIFISKYVKLPIDA